MRIGNMALLAVIAILGIATSTAAASAPSPETRPVFEKVYTDALRCTVANGYASLERRDAGDTANSAFYDSKAREAFKMSYTAGHYLGYDDDRITRDMDRMQKAEMPKLMASVEYRRSVAATCKAIKLL